MTSSAHDSWRFSATTVFKDTFMKIYCRPLAALLPLLAVGTASIGLLLGGCGSGGRTISAGNTVADRSATGNATLQIQWPIRKVNSKLIPVASNTILVQISFRGKIIVTKTVARPSGANPVSTLSFPSLPVGQLGVVIYALPDTTVASETATPTDAQAMGTGVLNVTANKTTTLTITLDTTIVKLVIFPQPTSGTDFINYGAMQTFDVEALDASGDMVLVSPQTISWTTDAPPLFTIVQHTSDTGVDITAGTVSGDTVLTVTESESGLSSSIPVSVRGPLAAVKITTILPTVDVSANGLNAGVVQFAYLGTDASGFVIPNANTGSANWSSSNTSIASIGANSGLAIALSPGAAAGSMSATSIITLSVGSLPPVSTILTVNLLTGTTRLSPNTVTLGVGTAQDFHSDTRNPNPTVNENVLDRPANSRSKCTGHRTGHDRWARLLLHVHCAPDTADIDCQWRPLDHHEGADSVVRRCARRDHHAAISVR